MVLGGGIFLNVCKLLDVDEKDNLTSPLESFSEPFSTSYVLTGDFTLHNVIKTSH